MPLEQPIAKGATLRVRDAARQASLVSSVPPPNQFFPSGSPVDSEPPSTSSDASTPSSSSAYDSASDMDSDEASDDNSSSASSPVAIPRRHRHHGRGKFDSGLLPNNKSAKACTPSPSISSASSIASADDYFSAGTFLSKVYPRSTQVHRAVSVSAGGDADSIWKLAVLDNKDSKSLYAKGAAGFEGINLRENLVDLLDLADEELDCDRVVVVLDKSDANLAQLLHSLLYVGGVVLPPASDAVHGRHSSKNVLVSIDV